MTTGAFVGTVCLIAVRRSVSGRTGCRRCGRVGKTPRLCSSTCLAPSWYVSPPWSICPQPVLRNAQYFYWCIRYVIIHYKFPHHFIVCGIIKLSRSGSNFNAGNIFVNTRCISHWPRVRHCSGECTVARAVDVCGVTYCFLLLFCK